MRFCSNASRQMDSSGRASLARSRAMRGSAVRSSISSRAVPSGAGGFRPATPSASTGAGLAPVWAVGVASGVTIAVDPRGTGGGRRRPAPAPPAPASSSSDGLPLRLTAKMTPAATATTTATAVSARLPRDETPSSSSASALLKTSSRLSSILRVLAAVSFDDSRRAIGCACGAVIGGGSSRARALPGGVAVDLRT